MDHMTKVSPALASAWVQPMGGKKRLREEGKSSGAPIPPAPSRPGKCSNCSRNRQQECQKQTVGMSDSRNVHDSRNVMDITDELANLVNNTDEKLHPESKSVNMVDSNSTSCGMRMVILMLLVATVVIAVWLPTGGGQRTTSHEPATEGEKFSTLLVHDSCSK